MQYGCPVCNGVARLNMFCPGCGQIMEDVGMIEDYYGPYSPYDNMDLYEPPRFWKLADTLPCVHLFSCSGCGRDKRVGIPQVIMA